MISPETFAEYAARRVPRYTSYPTAPNFSPAIDHAECRRWLRSVPPESAVSVYLHIPFCREMCWYCGCHTSVVRRQAPIGRYVDSMLKEVELVAAELPGRLKIGHLHWGGGSPTLLAPADVGKIHGALSTHFSLDELNENAVEIDPRTLSEDAARAFAGAGVNRASVGVQTFDPEVQQAINRVQSFETTERAVGMLRSNGIAAVNFDLIYGLPFQSVSACARTVELALKLKPDRISVFGYAHVPGFKPHQRKIDESALAGPQDRFRQARAIADALIAAGYRQIGLDHFALPGDSLAQAAEEGRLRRNFQGYTADTCTTLLGFGASAIGRLPQGYVQNAARIPDYERRIAGGRLAVTRGCAVTADDERRGAIIERLMCDYRCDVGELAGENLSRLERDGLVRRSGSVIEIPEEARPLVRTVAAAFDSYLPGTADRHVGAV